MSPTFYQRLLRQFPRAKKVKTYKVSTEKLLERLLYEKVACKMLLKLTTGHTGSHFGQLQE